MRSKADWESTRTEWEAEGFKFQKSCLPWTVDCPTKDLVRRLEDGSYESLEGVRLYAPDEVIDLGPVIWTKRTDI
jgi:hypothetical protein